MGGRSGGFKTNVRVGTPIKALHLPLSVWHKRAVSALTRAQPYVIKKRVVGAKAVLRMTLSSEAAFTTLE
jgi:hypothetical protein